jgi:Uma2 family endonuclease
MTAEELWHSPLNGKGVELVRGEVETKMPPSVDHGAVATNIAVLLKLWCRQHDGGWVGVESGFILDRDPDTLRGPDVAFVRASRIPPGGRPYPFWEQPADLIVEVVSPSDTAAEIETKVTEYLEAGTPEVWIVYPQQREVLVHRPDDTAGGFARSRKSLRRCCRTSRIGWRSSLISKVVANS